MLDGVSCNTCIDHGKGNVEGVAKHVGRSAALQKIQYHLACYCLGIGADPRVGHTVVCCEYGQLAAVHDGPCCRLNHPDLVGEFLDPAKRTVRLGFVIQYRLQLGRKLGVHRFGVGWVTSGGVGHLFGIEPWSRKNLER